MPKKQAGFDIMKYWPVGVAVVSFIVGYSTLQIQSKANADDIKTVKPVAYSAKTVADQNAKDIAEMKQDFKDFHTEYKDDQKDLASVLRDISKAVKA